LRDRQTDRQTDRDTDTDTETERKTVRQRQRDRDRETETERQRAGEREREKSSTDLFQPERRLPATPARRRNTNRTSTSSWNADLATTKCCSARKIAQTRPRVFLQSLGRVSDLIWLWRRYMKPERMINTFSQVLAKKYIENFRILEILCSAFCLWVEGNWDFFLQECFLCLSPSWIFNRIRAIIILTCSFFFRCFLSFLLFLFLFLFFFLLFFPFYVDSKEIFVNMLLEQQYCFFKFQFVSTVIVSLREEERETRWWYVN